VNIGTSPDGGSTFALPRLVGTRRAMELALLGDRFGAADALRLGLVNRVVPAARVQGEATALAARLAAGPGLAIARTKRLVNASFDNSLETQLQAEAEAFAASAVTEDFAEGVRAFLAKRPPQFRGH
jgi:2-(1,2-epoxy-1,2-dihydrophenyl)acetyl-CoA isomerase